VENSFPLNMIILFHIPRFKKIKISEFFPQKIRKRIELKLGKKIPKLSQMFFKNMTKFVENNTSSIVFHV